MLQSLKPLKQLLLPNDVAKLLGIPRARLDRWGRENRGPPPHRIGGRHYYSKTLLKLWIEAQAAEPSAIQPSPAAPKPIVDPALKRGKMLLRGNEVAELLGINPGTLDGWREKNRGPPARLIGKRFYYSRILLEEWLRAQAAGEQRAAPTPRRPPR